MTSPSLVPSRGPLSSGAHGNASGGYRVVIVKADRFCADTIRTAVLQVYPAAEIVICATAKDAMEAFREERVQLAIIGLTLPDADGLDLLSVVLSQGLAGRCMIVSGRRDERSRRLLKTFAGCDYFDTGTEKSAALIAALQTMAKGQIYCSRIRPECDPVDDRNRIPLHQMFSPRELEIFSFLGTGADDHESAGQLNMSAATVKSHRARIMKKLGIQTRAELMREAVFRGVVRFGGQRVIRPGFERDLIALPPVASSTPPFPSLPAASWVVV